VTGVTVVTVVTVVTGVTVVTVVHVHDQDNIQYTTCIYSSAPVSTGNTFQDLLRLGETADNTKRYI
jgi:hypothetical protein